MKRTNYNFRFLTFLFFLLIGNLALIAGNFHSNLKPKSTEDLMNGNGY